MSESHDVAARLADARPAVENLQQYVWACHQVGYSHADLTVHAGQVRDWYSSEDGMDLEVLGRDAAALEAVAAACHEARALQDRQVGALSAAWAGPGADACREFLHRHGGASAAVAAAVRTSAEALTDAADRLWRLVDAKAGIVAEIEGRTADTRDQWLAAAATLSTGAGDRSAAAETVDHAVKPFVDSTIRGEWLTAMQNTIAAVTDTYRTAAAEVTSHAIPDFAVPGELGPRPPVVCAEDRACTEPVGAAPVVGAAPAMGSPLAAAPPPASVVPAAPAPVVPAAATPPAPLPESLAAPPPAPVTPPAAPAPVGSPGDLGGELSGLGQQFSDTLRGLLGGGADGFEPPDLDAPELEEPGLDELEDDIEDDDPEEEDPENEQTVPLEESADPPVEEAAPPPVDDCAPPAPTPAPEPAPPPVIEPLPPEPAEPVAAEQTPCEIAAGEVPQVGEQPG